MAPCTRLTFEQCLDMNKITPLKYDSIEAYEHDADLLCGNKTNFWAEKISAATVVIIVYLICKGYIQIVEHSVMLKKSSLWGEGKPHHEEGRRAMLRATILNCVLWTCLYVGTSFGSHYLANPLDRRANNMVVGFSNLFAGVTFIMLSVSVPKWLGFYHARKLMRICPTSSKEIHFNFSFNLFTEMSSMLFFNMYFSQADNDHSVLWGACVGFPLAFILLYMVILARTKFKERKNVLSFLLAFILSVGSWMCMWNGFYFIIEVWQPDFTNMDSNIVALLYSLLWVLAIIVVHVGFHIYTRRQERLGKSSRFGKSTIFTENVVKSGLESVLNSKTCSKDGDNVDDVIVDEEEGESKVDDLELNDVAADEDDDQNQDKTASSQRSQESNVRFADDTAIDSVDDSRVKKCGFNKTGSQNAVYVEKHNAPSFWDLFATKMVMAYPICCKCCKRAKDKHHVDNISRRRLDYVEEGYSKTCWESFVLLLSRFCWYFLSLVFFALTIVNIGASFEQCKAQVNLAAAWEKLYPDNYRTGVMCAWDKNGPPGPNSDIKTFLTVKDVEDANYEIIHCGACGDCSNWNDIQLQYTSRKVLAGITKTCARRSIFKKVNVSDTNDEIVQCNAQLVGFTIPCSKAWAWDEVHTKGLATFTFLQAQTNNAFADMEVTFQDITMATIDESLSGPTFVPWVGATRRRMNIISDIRRPDYQQCTVATQNWTEVFNDTFYPPVGGTYVVQPPGKPSETIVVIGQDAFNKTSGL